MLYAAFGFVSLFIRKFNGLNFPEWSEQVQFHLGVLDLDLSLLTNKLAAIIETNSAKQRYFYKVWERLNRLSDGNRLASHNHTIRRMKTQKLFIDLIANMDLN